MNPVVVTEGFLEDPGPWDRSPYAGSWLCHGGIDEKGDSFWAGSGWDFDSGSGGGSLSTSYPVNADTFVCG